LNDAWIRSATNHGLFGGNGVFLLSVSLGPPENPDPPFWATVSLMESFDIAGTGAELGIFGPRRGMVEFAMASIEGKVVIRGTVWEQAAGLLVLTDADRSKRLRSFTRGVIDRGLLSQEGQHLAELWLSVE
jgi:hypothetical protein